MEIGLSLGSNIGDRLDRLQDARRRLLALPAMTLLAQAPVYETQPVDVLPAHRDMVFLNTVLIVEAGIPVTRLQARLQDIERAMGRPNEHQTRAPRTIDIDIVYAGNLAVKGPDLTLPHPRWHTRRFVVQPLSDVRPQLRLPGQPATVAQVLASLPESPRVTLVAREW